MCVCLRFFAAANFKGIARGVPNALVGTSACACLVWRVFAGKFLDAFGKIFLREDALLNFAAERSRCLVSAENFARVIIFPLRYNFSAC